MALIYKNLTSLAAPMEGCNLSVLQSLMNQIDTGTLSFYEKQEGFKLKVQMDTFNMLKIDTVLYSKINLPFQISVYNNTFMKTRVFRLVSRKIPNTINWSSNLVLPFDIEIGETRSFVINIAIDSLDDLDQLIYNDLAFVMYSDNTTLSEIDFAIRVPDIRGLTRYSKTRDTTLDLEDWYLSGILSLEDLIPKVMSLDDDVRIYSKLKNFQNFVDLSTDSTYGQAATEALLSDIQDNNKLEGLKSSGMPADFIYNIINLRESRSFRDKFKFNILRFTYFEGITERNLNVGFNEAREIFTSQIADNEDKIETNLEQTDITTQKQNLDGLIFMMRVPFFGSQFMYFDTVFFVINTKREHFYQVFEQDMGNFVGDYIRLSALFNEDPFINDVALQYDISSQVKENLTTFKSFEAPDYVKPNDSTEDLAYKIVGLDMTTIFTDIISESDVTLSYYQTNPILAYKKNQIVYEHSETFRENMLAYDQTNYFGIDETDSFPEDNSISLYTVDYTVEKWVYNTIAQDYTQTGTDQTISNTVSLSISNEVKNSFKILSTKNVSNGASSLLLSDTTKDLDIVWIDKFEVFNNGNTFLNLSNVEMFYPNGKFKLNQNFESLYGSDMVKEAQLVDDADFYKSFFDRDVPVEAMAFNTLAPGETGDIYIIYRLNRTMLHEYLSEFFKIPIYLRLEFNENMSAYFCNMATKEFESIARYNLYTFGNGERNAIGNYYPYYQQMQNEQDQFKPSDQQIPYAHINTSIDMDDAYQKSYLQHDLAYFAGATIKSNKYDNSYIDMNRFEPTINKPLHDKNMIPFSQTFIMPVGVNYGNVATISDLINSYNVLLPSEITYKFFMVNFSKFFDAIIDDMKNNFWLVSLTTMLSESSEGTIMYSRYDISNEYEWYDQELDDIETETTPINISWLKDLYANVTINIPETQLNIFKFRIPKPLEFVNLYAMANSLFDSLTGPADEGQEDLAAGKVKSNDEIEELAGKSKRQYFKDRFFHRINFGEIVGNKPLTMGIETSYFNLFRIKSFDNLELQQQAIGPGVPDVYSMKILDPSLEYANVVFEFFKFDYTSEMVWTAVVEENIAQNSGNYMITPSYFDLGYIPIDETYSVMVKIKNQNPYNVDLNILHADIETSNAIQLIGFPDNDDYNKIYLHLSTLRRPYTMLPNEEVKMFFRILPRRIGMNFFTRYLTLNNAIRPVNFEFRSFINNKAYFVLDEDSKTLDFGDVPIGKFEDNPIVVKNIGNVIGKINSIYIFGNDSGYFKLLDRDSGNEISDRLSYNKVVRAKSSLSIPIRFFSQSYGFNYSYAYIETNEPVLEDAQQFDMDENGDDFTQLYRNAPKYLVSLLKGNSVIEGEAIETDSYIFLGYVHPLRSKFRNYEVVVRNKNRNKVISIFKVTNLMKNYVKVKYTRDPFSKESSLFIQLNPRGYTEGQYYDEIFVQMIVYDKKTKQNTFVLNKIPVSQYVTRESRLSFDVDLEEIIFATKPFIKTFKKINVRNYSNEDSTMYLHLLTDHSGLITLIPNLSDQTMIIPEGANFSFMVAFGGDQRFIGKYDSMITIQITLGNESIIKYVPITGIIGDENIVKFYRRNRIIIST